MVEMPYFMENEDWYYYDGEIYRLTDKAPAKAIESYNEFYNEMEEIDEEVSE